MVLVVVVQSIAASRLCCLPEPNVFDVVLCLSTRHVLVDTQCWCGDANSDIYRYGSATCDYPCAGDAEETCGGYAAMSVYEYGGLPGSEIPDGTKYLGCYKDGRFDRALSLKLTSNNDMTHEVLWW